MAHRYQSLLDDVAIAAQAEGFVLSGVAPAVTSPGHSDLVNWIDQGYAAGMGYFTGRIDAYEHPSGVLPGAKSIIVLAYPYPAANHQPTPPGSGKLARYTWLGDDYHDVLHPKLKKLCRLIRDHDLVQASEEKAAARGIVDTAPLMEREVAQLAGLGWRGKNTLLLNKKLGSYFLLACVLVNIELPLSDPHESSHCGTCTACLDACPTDAFPQAGVVDASRCISYLTIEHRESIDVELRSGIGDWLFGCDICQEVCPWNTKPARDASKPTAIETLELTELFKLSDDDFRARFRKTPLWRTRRRGILRNAAIVLGNTGDFQSIPALRIGLADEESMVRETCQWAIDQIEMRFA